MKIIVSNYCRIYKVFLEVLICFVVDYFLIFVS